MAEHQSVTSRTGSGSLQALVDPAAGDVAIAPFAGGGREPRRGSPLRRSISTAAAVGTALALTVAFTASASWPVASRSSYVSQWYRSTHRAIDVAAARGTRIIPIRSGRVVFAGWKSNCGGYQVWVYHGNGLYSAYYHLSREISWRGRPVSPSSTLGYVGTSGCASGPHVHVEVWHGSPWRSGSYRVNPWRYMDSGTYEPARYR